MPLDPKARTMRSEYILPRARSKVMTPRFSYSATACWQVRPSNSIPRIRSRAARSLPSICTVTPGIWRRLSAADRLLKSIGRKSVFVKRVFLAFPPDIRNNRNSDHLEASVWSVT